MAKSPVAGAACPRLSCDALTRSSTAARRSSFGHIYAESYRCGVKAGEIVRLAGICGRRQGSILWQAAVVCKHSTEGKS